nr:Chain F, Histone H3.1 peptide with K9M mutation [Homo sapiens]5JIN_G Chain G, Histone H3.1 peptide with K9M mutation [Homo sapiens]5JJ0_F Chain F, Histone H3K9M mutant peptide [Homo sapiens]5JJ0_G Chain G, Histone H3K9M mutant peptide [Homo sapiens]
TKQTARMSTGG